MITRFTFAAFCVGFLGVSASAHAATVSQTLNFDLSYNVTEKDQEYSSFRKTIEGRLFFVDTFDAALGTLNSISVTMVYDISASVYGKYTDYGFLTNVSAISRIKKLNSGVTLEGINLAGADAANKECLAGPKKNASCEATAELSNTYELRNSFFSPSKFDTFINGTPQIAVGFDFDGQALGSSVIWDKHIVDEAIFSASMTGWTTITYDYTPSPVSSVPLPAGGLLLGGALLCLRGIGRRSPKSV